MERKMLVIGDEIEPETEYTGTAAKIYGVIGVILAVFFFLLSFLPVGIFVLDSINGQVIDNSSVSINDDMRYYDSDILSFEYPNTYSMYEEKEMLVVLGEKGKVIIGGFEPSVGHPDPEEVHFLFQGIWYNKDPKMEVDRGVPSAVYYAHGDEETQKEIRQIVGSIEVKNL
ncbi:hypothetical protein KKG22_03110 [Patescibacteria group bacterium]|nr:hypothetical protein [Patescibacteria group bacterium]MBU1721367.1 hypothetical protein [Patescibacteria group bacterium]